MTTQRPTLRLADPDRAKAIIIARQTGAKLQPVKTETKTAAPRPKERRVKVVAPINDDPETRLRRKIRWAMLPYGLWYCADGRQVLFNRHYRPIWQRSSDKGQMVPADPDEWVEVSHVEWFYTDGLRNKITRAVAFYEKFVGPWDWAKAEASFAGADPRLSSATPAKKRTPKRDRQEQ